MEKVPEELIPNFFRVAYALRYIVEDNMRKIEFIKQQSLSRFQQKLTNQQVIILLRLTLVKSIPTSDLSESLNIALPNLVNQLNRLEEVDYVIKKTDPDDKRVVRNMLSNQGKELLSNKPTSLDEKYANYISLPDRWKKYDKIFRDILNDLESDFPQVYDAVYEYH